MQPARSAQSAGRTLKRRNGPEDRVADLLRGGVELPKQPLQTSEDGFWTLRTRQHGNRALPLPPLMDPLAIARKEKYTAAKTTKQGGEWTDFQRRLAQNAYARALATNVRYCGVTKARLPVHFLLPLRITVPPSVEATQENGKEGLAPAVIPDLQLPGVAYATEVKTSPSRCYVFLRQGLLKNVDEAWIRLGRKVIPHTMRAWYEALHSSNSGRHSSRALTLDSGIQGSVLEHLRADVVRRILGTPPEQIVAGDTQAERISSSHSLLCVVRLEISEADSATTARHQGSSIPVFCLGNLLDPDSLHQIQVALPGKVVSLLNGPHAWKTVASIEKLRLFVVPARKSESVQP